MKKIEWKGINWKQVNREKIVLICNRLSIPLQFLGCALLYLVIESISRHSLWQGISYMTSKPWVFLYNTFLVFLPFTLAYLVRRRVFLRTLIGLLWFILGCVNGVLLSSRVTPFTGPDLKLIGDALRVLNKYLSPVMVVVVIILLIIAALVLIWMFFKAPKYKGKLRYPVNIALVVCIALAFWGTTNLALQKRVLSNYFGNIAFAYEDYGYPYCLATTVFNTGISQPNGYSEELMDYIVESEGEIQETDSDQKTNIIFLQLESFFDPTLVDFLELSEDPIPNFRRLMEEYSSGYYRVPSVGAGTANTEFESITGMSMHYFGPGEYPYKSILKEETCESVPFVLDKLGYSSHAIHNNEANFYSRKTVFSKLGFDTFTSEEYMADISDTTPQGWVKDHVLTDEIMKCLESTSGPDYIYTISVQGHGDYPTEPLLTDPKITVTGAETREKNNYSWEYYVNQLYEMDQFIQELVETLEAFDEPTVLVMYGDHLPTMGLEVKDLKNRYLFQTQYVIWDNIGLDRKVENLAAYQMAAEVMNRLDIHEGQIFNYHQTRRKTKNYQVDLEALQYDMLYGERYVFGGENPYEATDMALGAVPIRFDGIVEIQPGTWYVTGDNFTASSYLEVNGELADTTLLSSTTLLVKDLVLEEGDEICVAQQSNSSTHRVLSRTESQIYHVPVQEETTGEEAGASETTMVPGESGDSGTETAPDESESGTVSNTESAE